MRKRVYRKTAGAMSAHIMLMEPEHRPTVVYARYRGTWLINPLYHERIELPNHLKLIEAENKPGFVSFFIYE